MAYFLKRFLFAYVALIPQFGWSSPVVTLRDTAQEYELANSTIEIFADPSMRMTLAQVIQQYAGNPASFSVKGEQVNNPKAAYWVRFTLRDLSSGKYNWLLELYDNRLDDLELYMPDKKGNYTCHRAGDNRRFSEKDFQHINFVFQLPPISSDETVFYMRMYSKHEIYLYGLVRSTQRYVAYTTNEYFYVSIFYGVLLALAIYNLLMLLSVRDRDNSYIYYILYVISTAFYSLSRDGMGFQFVWPYHPFLNTIAEPLGLYCLAISLLLYAREFLNTKVNNPTLDKLILITVLARTFIFVIGLMISGQFTRNIYWDFPLMLLAYVAGFVSYRKGYKASRYYIIGFTFLFIDFCMILMEAFGVVINDVMAFYSFNMGVVIQFLVLSIALGDRVRLIIREKNEAQENFIMQLKEEEAYKDQLNMQLEEKVKERTLALEDKNAQLDSFVYKASHDIKGPLRSLMGLTKVGLVDFEKNPEVAMYFQHIMKTATKLDVILEDLLAVTKLTTSQLQKTPIKVEAMIDEILDTFTHLVGVERLKITRQIVGGDKLVTDEKVLYSVLQNLIENAIKYQDDSKSEATLDIHITVTDKEARFVFADNGPGIDDTHLAKIFDMFYKVNDKSIGSGLGLYILKQAVLKLQGTVNVNSVQNVGTTFTVVIPNGE